MVSRYYLTIGWWPVVRHWRVVLLRHKVVKVAAGLQLSLKPRAGVIVERLLWKRWGLSDESRVRIRLILLDGWHVSLKFRVVSGLLNERW